MSTEEWFVKAKRLFKKKKMPHDQIAEVFGLSPAAISLKLAGVRNSTWDDIVKFANILEVTPVSLVSDNPELPETIIESEILETIKYLPQEQQEIILTVAKSLKTKHSPWRNER